MTFLSIISSGAFWFGLVIGYITYRTLQKKKEAVISDIATVLAAIGGGAVLALFPADTTRFDCYAIGLAIGFFLYLAISMLVGKNATATFLGD